MDEARPAPAVVREGAVREGVPGDVPDTEAVMTEQRERAGTVPEEFGQLVTEFRGLLERYPGADAFFALAYHPDGLGDGPERPGTTSTAGITQPVYECEKIEPGLQQCRRAPEV
ncbi:hypothetical protein [Streptomyces zhihengii]|uniref:hypothetical protein n=1 Tax=Streptomyces zhihengii TaxID=1818004 RepID=UPI0033B7AC1B